MLHLVLEGGGMRAGFVAGAIMALMDKRLIDFDVALAVSASVPTLAYFVTGQRKEIEQVWRHELNTSKLVCYRNIPAAPFTLSGKRPVLNIDYLVYEVFKKRYPLDLNALLNNRTLCYFAVTSLPEVSLKLFRPGDADIYKIFNACLAVPGCYPTTVPIGEREYLDGGTLNPLPVQSVLDQTKDEVVAILSKPLDCETNPPSFLERALFWRYLKSYDWMIDRLWDAAHLYNEEVFFLEMLSQKRPARAFIICPDNIPPAKFLTRDWKKINRTIDLGYRKVEELEEGIRDFVTHRQA